MRVGTFQWRQVLDRQTQDAHAGGCQVSGQRASIPAGRVMHRDSAGRYAWQPAGTLAGAGRHEVPAFAEPVAAKRDGRLREGSHDDDAGARGTLPLTSLLAGTGGRSWKKPCSSSSGSGKMIVLFFSAAISVRVWR